MFAFSLILFDSNEPHASQIRCVTNLEPITGKKNMKPSAESKLDTTESESLY